LLVQAAGAHLFLAAVAAVAAALAGCLLAQVLYLLGLRIHLQ
jgi:hypothetical protein